MRKLILIPLTIFTILSVIIGCIIHGESDGITIDFNAKYESYDFSNELNIKKLDTINIDASLMSINISEGNAYSVKCKCSKKIKPTVTYSDENLSITQKGNNKSHFGFGLFSINKKCELDITIPDKTKLKEINAKTALGDIKIKDLESSKIILDSDLGDNDMENCKSDEISMKNSLGDATIDNSTFKKVDIDESMGNVKILCKEELKDFSYDLKTSMGDIKVFDNKCDNKYVSDNSKDNKIYIRNSMGDIKIKKQ